MLTLVHVHTFQDFVVLLACQIFPYRKALFVCEKIIIYFFPRRASFTLLRGKHGKSVKYALYVRRSHVRSFEKLRYIISAVLKLAQRRRLEY